MSDADQNKDENAAELASAEDSDASAAETSNDDGGAGASARGPERRKLKSTKLDRTLAELENAFDSWNSVVPAKKQAVSPGHCAPLIPTAEETEFKTRTKSLLSQLREQLAELSDD